MDNTVCFAEFICRGSFKNQSPSCRILCFCSFGDFFLLMCRAATASKIGLAATLCNPISTRGGGRLCPTYTGVLGWLKIAVAALCWLDFRLPLGFEMKNVSMYFDMYVVIIFNLWSLDKAWPLKGCMKYIKVNKSRKQILKFSLEPENERKIKRGKFKKSSVREWE